MTTRAIIEPTDEFLASLSVPQLLAIYRSHRRTIDTVNSMVLTNRVIARLLDLVGEETTAKLID